MGKPQLQRRSILEGALNELAREQDDAVVTLQEKPFTGRMVLRALENLSDDLKDVLGTGLPEQPNTIAHGEKAGVFWLRERQWLIVTKPESYEGLKRDIDQALSNKNSSLVDISDGYTALELSGPKARDVLMKGCPLDIHPRVFPVGAMAQTRIAHADILLHHTEDDSFAIYIRNSFAEYLLRWLYDAALEYGIQLKKGETQ